MKAFDSAELARASVSVSHIELVVGVMTALGGLAAAAAAWWAAKVALRVAGKDRRVAADREARTEAWSLFNVRIEKLLALMTVTERAAHEGGLWVDGKGRKMDPRFRTTRADGDGPATAELRAHLLISREYLPLTRSLLLEGMPFSAGDAHAAFEALAEELDDDYVWFGLELNDVAPIGLQVARAEILLTVRGLERAAKSVAASTAADASVLSGWELAFKPVTSRFRSDAP